MTLPARIPLSLAGVGLLGLALGIAATMGWATLHPNRTATEAIVHDYLLAHPEVLPEAMDHLHAQETARALATLRGPVEAPFPGAVLGNPHGRVTLVEFTDYACGYCRASTADVAALIATNPDLRVVVREMPILTPASADAARMALAAARQGHYAAFHQAMFAGARPDAGSIAHAAQIAQVDTTHAADPQAEAEIERNLELGRRLGLSGTPGWVIGNRIATGRVGLETLRKAIAEARG